MKKALPTILIIINFIFLSVTASGQDSLNNQLLRAVWSVDTARILYLLDHGADIGAKDDLGTTVLMAAQDHNELIELLLKRGADIEAKDTLGRTVLMQAAKNNYADTIKLLLDHGADIEATDSSGATPLIVAADSSQVSNWQSKDVKTDAMSLLLDRGANIEAKDIYGKTALFLATDSGHEKKSNYLRLLLARGANIETKEKFGRTALFTAVYSAYVLGNPNAVQILLEHGANVLGKDDLGETVLTQAACDIGSSEANKLVLVKLLVDKGADIDAQNKLGKTALACAQGKKEQSVADYLESTVTERKLIERGASLNVKDRFALYLSAYAKNPRDEALRQRIIALTSQLTKAPAIPEEARQLLTLATDQIKQANSLAALDQPIALLRKALEIAPWWSKAYYTLSRALEMRGQYDDAILQLNYYLKLNPPDPDAQQARAHLVVIQTKNIFAASLKSFQQNPNDASLREKVIQLSFNIPEPQPIPEEARQLFTLATDQIKQAGTPAALDRPIALLRKALEIAPWWGNAYYNLSRVLEMRGQYDDAARQLNYYLELKPAEADANEARAHLVVIQTEKDAAAQAQARQNAENENLVKAADAQHPLQAPVDNGRLKNQQMAAANPPARSRAGNPLPDPKLVWTDPATGLEWTKRDNAIDVTWEQAKAYCANLRLGGAGWRLPTIDELQGIYDPSLNVPGHMGYPKLGYDVVWHVKGNIKPSSLPWSSTVSNEYGGPWTINFSNGASSPQGIDAIRGMRALCVRSSGE